MALFNSLWLSQINMDVVMTLMLNFCTTYSDKVTTVFNAVDTIMVKINVINYLSRPFTGAKTCKFGELTRKNVTKNFLASRKKETSPTNHLQL